MNVGIAYYRLADYEHSEQALNESNILNNLNPCTWAYLCLLCLKASRPEEADFAFNQALKQAKPSPPEYSPEPVTWIDTPMIRNGVTRNKNAIRTDLVPSA